METFLWVEKHRPITINDCILPENLKKTFKDFVESNGVNKFDVVFSFAMTIQVRDEDNMAESDIAKGHYDLTKPGGVMIYETQKLQSRPKNQDHVDKMLEAFRSNYGKEIETGEAWENILNNIS